jgi:ADP-heptose:LPS heptosyltransferase
MLIPDEVRFLEESLNADLKSTNIRLREGEHQYDLAKAIASFQLELRFPDVKDVVIRLYGEEKTADIQLVRKVQTILKKMEKSGIVQILPKKRPWELQRYALSSFKFQDADKNIVVFGTDEELERTRSSLKSSLNQNVALAGRATKTRIMSYIFLLMLAIAGSYALIVWDITQPVVSPAIFIVGLAAGVASSIGLGRVLSERGFRPSP